MLRKIGILGSASERSGVSKRRRYGEESGLGDRESSPVEEMVAGHEGHSAFEESEQQLQDCLALSTPLFIDKGPVRFDMARNEEYSPGSVVRVKSSEGGSQNEEFDVGAFLVGPEEESVPSAQAESLPALERTQSPPPRQNRKLEEHNVTPVKFHIAKEEVGKKSDGLASGYILKTASGKNFMFKPECGKLTWSFWEMVNEIVAGNLYRLYLGKSRSPVIGVCESQVRGDMQFGAASEMFGFTQLFESGWRDRKPEGFEEVIATSVFLGDPDPHVKNIGLNSAGELSKLDHGRAFMAEFLNGLDFLDYMTRVCKYNYYAYTISIDAIELQLKKISSIGAELPIAIIQDAFKCIEENAAADLLPTQIDHYVKGRWVDPAMRKAEGAPRYGGGYIPMKNWSEYSGYLTAIFNTNYQAIGDAICILADMKKRGYEVVNIGRYGSASMPDSNPKVCADFQKYAAIIKAEREREGVPGKFNIKAYLDVYRADKDEQKGL